uniref:hypothetical protein n=1 Tax=Pseudomonas atacamensis TaxID=2565368 RepID=UPI002B1D9C10
QCAGCPIWLEYVETFAGGGERVKQQFVGAAHDQEVGLSYLAEVEWLRGCKADSTLAVVLKVGFYLGAVQSEAVACQVRNYGVKAGLDDLTTFDNYNWNHWAQSTTYKLSNIVLSSNEYFLEAIFEQTYKFGVFLCKSYQDIETGTQFEFSFEFRSATSMTAFLAQNNVRTYHDLPASESWQSVVVPFRSAASSTPKTLMLLLSVDNPIQSFSINNLRLKKT